METIENSAIIEKEIKRLDIALSVCQLLIIGIAGLLFILLINS
jgi:hypothetical protein